MANSVILRLKTSLHLLLHTNEPLYCVPCFSNSIHLQQLSLSNFCLPFRVCPLAPTASQSLSPSLYTTPHQFHSGRFDNPQVATCPVDDRLSAAAGRTAEPMSRGQSDSQLFAAVLLAPSQLLSGPVAACSS